MTSAIGRDDIRDLAWKYGIKDPRQLNDLMRIVDAYAWTLARSMTRQEEEPEEEEKEKPPPRKRAAHLVMYLCRSCGGRFTLGFFPEAKKTNPAIAADCVQCGGGVHPKLYRCTGKGMCGQSKPLAEFPVRKQQDTSLRVPCSWCDDRRITRRNAR